MNKETVDVKIVDSPNRIIVARIAAYIIDALILFLINALSKFVIIIPDNIFSFLSLLSPFYFIYCHAMYGQTIGKQLFHIKVIDFNSREKISFIQAFNREIFWLLYVILDLVLTFGFPDFILEHDGIIRNIGSLITLGILISILADKNNRGIHDKIAKTVVISTHSKEEIVPHNINQKANQ